MRLSLKERLRARELMGRAATEQQWLPNEE